MQNNWGNCEWCNSYDELTVYIESNFGAEYKHRICKKCVGKELFDESEND
jgi:hypothetical protein